MREWLREQADDLAAGGYLAWVYLNPFDGRMWY
jgi:hypothetical protein